MEDVRRALPWRGGGKSVIIISTLCKFVTYATSIHTANGRGNAEVGSCLAANMLNHRAPAAGGEHRAHRHHDADGRLV